MSTSMSVDGSPIVLKKGVTPEVFNALFDEHMDDYADSFDLEENPNGTYSLAMEASDVGDSFPGRISAFMQACSAMLQMPFYLKITDCDTGDDDERYETHFAGPTPESMRALEQAVVLESVIADLRQAGLSHMAEPLQVHFDGVKPFIVSTHFPVTIPFALQPSLQEASKYFRTLLTIEVISEDRPASQTMDLATLQHEITEGEYSGRLLSSSVMELSPDQARVALESQGSDASFFSSLADVEDDHDLDEQPN